MAEEVKKSVVLSFEDWLAKETGEGDATATKTEETPGATPDTTVKPEEAGAAGPAQPAGDDDSDLLLLDEPQGGGEAQPAAPVAQAAQPAAPAA